MTRGLVLGLLSVAATLTGCGPPIDAAARADVDGRIAKLQVRATTIAAPARGERAPTPPAAGQWVQYKMMLSTGQPAIRTEKVLRQEGDAFWYEVVSDTYQGRTVEQLLVAFGNDGQRARVELRGLRKKDAGGRVVELSARDLSLPSVPNDDYRAMIAALVAPWPPQPQELTVVPAGRFEGCYHKHSEIHFGARNGWVTDSWRHPSVPLSGLVRMQDNHAFARELIDYGTTGAQSDF